MQEIDLSDAEVVRDPFAAYGRVREQAPLARLRVPGLDPWWVVTRHEPARAMLADPRLEIRADSFMRPGVPDDCLPYMRTMSEMNGPEHARMRKLVAPAFTPRRAAEFRPRIERIVEELLADVEERAARDGTVDLLPHFARPLPMDVICALVGVPGPDRPRWRAYGATVAAGAGREFAEAIPGIMDGAKAAIARRRAEPGDDLLADLITAQAEDGDRLTDTEMVTMVLTLVLAGHETTAHLIGNTVAALLAHPDQLARLRADPGLLPGAVHEFVRRCSPIHGTRLRYATEDIEVGGVTIRRGEAVMAVLVAANHDPRHFADPERFDITRQPDPRRETHLGFGHGPHYCLGAALARQEAEVAIGTLLRRFPGLRLAVPPERLDRQPVPMFWRLARLPVRLGP